MRKIKNKMKKITAVILSLLLVLLIPMQSEAEITVIPAAPLISDILFPKRDESPALYKTGDIFEISFKVENMVYNSDTTVIGLYSFWNGTTTELTYNMLESTTTISDNIWATNCDIQFDNATGKYVLKITVQENEYPDAILTIDEIYIKNNSIEVSNNNCNYVFLVNDNCASNNHTIKNDTQFIIIEQPTCTSEGSQGKNCIYCGHTIDETIEKIPAKGHTVKETTPFVTITHATCVSKGTQGKKCESCNEIIEETIEETPIDSKWHVGGTIKAENDEYYYTACKSCGANLSDGGIMDGESLPASGWTAKPTPQPTTEAQTNVSAKVTVKNTSIKKLKAKKKGFNITLKKISGVTGYEIKYSTKKNLKGAKIKKYKHISISINKLKSKKKYYIAARSYKIVNGKTYYSDWSKIKSVKTK